jgi:hypothetical protein
MKKEWFIAISMVLAASSAMAEIRTYQDESPTATPATDAKTLQEPVQQAAPQAVPSTPQIQGAVPVSVTQSAPPITNTLIPGTLSDLDTRWKQLVRHQQRERAEPGLLVFVQPESFTPSIADEIRDLFADPQVKALDPAIYMADRGPQGFNMVAAHALPEAEVDAKALEFNQDTGNEMARAYGVPDGQPTIVYRDPSGAVRLYNLSYEVDKLQRQLARVKAQGQSAQ